MLYKARIYVTLQEAVLDPAGTAVQKALQEQMGIKVPVVRIGKFIVVTLESDDRPTAEQTVHKMCQEFLANPVIEDYYFELEELPGVSDLAGDS
ncbi:MAG: phosphoribosylformylglycinamidine synthase subunit PurS [Pseudanabaenaceae cyanobacterium SKYGB_i_bin29]|nr:phosphoribosylformylglycinamidine synthase subunit PurS [Pseudanabaenaceae cyanobacterium SKYG29]MDW8421601.1 phosphoribosylformylglycinamidine synthase subunit PurS [Pseudanabaenaceae cyanobacterium SKYGB_i_bin29]